MAGRVTYFFSPISAALPQVKDGKLIALAVSSAQRSSALKDVPTIAESGAARLRLQPVGRACSDRRRCRPISSSESTRTCSAHLPTPEIKERLAATRRRADADDAGRVQAVRARRDGRRREGSSRQRASRDSSGASGRRGAPEVEIDGRRESPLEADNGPLGVAECLRRPRRATADRYIVALTEPPSITRFWPTMKPASALQRNAHALPNSSGVPKRPAGFSATRAARNVS